MYLDYTILGLLDWKDMSGYDIKKAVQNIPFFHWSGNNNQIYKILVKMAESGLIEGNVHHQDGAPSKKVYRVTKQGKEALHIWLGQTEPELPEYRKWFLIQLAWASESEHEAVAGLLTDYEEKLKVQLLMKEEQKRRAHDFPNRSAKESFLWNMACDNLIYTYEAELSWVKQVMEGWKAFEQV